MTKTTYHPLIHRIHRALRNQFGALALGAVFIAFSAITVLTGVSVVAQTLVTSTQATQSTAVDAQMEARSTSLRTDLISGQDPSLECDDRAGSAVSCAYLAADPDQRNLVTATVQGRHDLAGEDVSQDLTLHHFEANYIAGFDANGDPVWVEETGTRAHTFTQVVASGDRTTALDAEGYAWSWGTNDYGQLGTGDTADRSEPTEVVAPQGAEAPIQFSSLTRGTDNAVCGLEGGQDPENQGRLWCWGYNDNGQLGIGEDAVGSYAAKPVTPLTDLRFRDVKMSANTTCAITTGDDLYCWGANPGTGSATATPPTSPVLTRVREVAMDANTVVTVSTEATGGKLRNWTRSALGALGTEASPALPMAVGGGGAGSTALIIPTGQPGTDPGTDTPVEVSSPEVFRSVYVAPEETGLVKSVACAITVADKGYCWGAGGKGQLGNGTASDSATPSPVAGTYRLMELAPTSDSVVGIARTNVMASAGWLVGWGDNAKGQLAGQSGARSLQPVVLTQPSGARPSDFVGVEQSTGNKQSFCAAGKDARIFCWGNNDHGQSAPGGGAVAPLTPVAGVDAIDFAVGDEFVVAAGAGDTQAWGRNTLGQLGRGYTSLNGEPAPVARRTHHYATFSGYVPGGAR